MSQWKVAIPTFTAKYVITSKYLQSGVYTLIYSWCKTFLINITFGNLTTNKNDATFLTHLLQTIYYVNKYSDIKFD